jgi:hypothetical protein
MVGLRVTGGFIIGLLLVGCQDRPDRLDRLDMTGRWKLAAPNAPTCGMRFAGVPEAREGAIEPEGGCPGKFFTSRHWTLSADRLTIRDHKQAPLAQLKLSDVQFVGTSTTGTPVTLSRYPSPAS